MSEQEDIDAQLDRFRASEGDTAESETGNAVNAKSYGSSALIIKIGQDAEKLIASVISTLTRSSYINALATVGLVIVAAVSYVHTRETRMLEYYVMQLDGTVTAAGITKPEDTWAAKKRKENDK